MRSSSTALSATIRACSARRRRYRRARAEGDRRARSPEAVAPRPPRFARGGLIYEIGVRGLHDAAPRCAEAQRGTVAALAHPAVIAHLKKLGVGAVELMPIAAWIDERHLPPLGLAQRLGL